MTAAARAARIDLANAPSSMEQRAASWTGRAQRVVIAPPPPAPRASTSPMLPTQEAEPVRRTGRPRTPEPKNRILNIKVPDRVYWAVRSRADAGDTTISAVGCDLIDQALAAQIERKPILRADMTAAAIRNGFPVDSFVRLLLERGFQSFVADERAEVAGE